jgi:hypothetical protein
MEYMDARERGQAIGWRRAALVCRERPWLLVFGRLLGMIDDENLDRRVCLFQFEA